MRNEANIMRKQSKRILIVLLFLIGLLLIYIFAPLSLRISLRGLNGDILYEYRYSETGNALILQDSKDETITFVDTNVTRLFFVTDVRAYAVYNTKTGELTKLHGFHDPEKQYGCLTDYENWIALFSIQIPQMENGVPNIHFFQYGISTEALQEDTLFFSEVGNSFVFAKYNISI